MEKTGKKYNALCDGRTLHNTHNCSCGLYHYPNPKKEKKMKFCHRAALLW